MSSSSVASISGGPRSTPSSPPPISTSSNPTNRDPKPTKDEYCPLFMDCTEEPLSEAQKSAQDRQTSAFLEQMKKLEEMAKAGAQITHRDNGQVSLRVTESSLVATTTNTVTNVAGGNSQPVSLLTSGPTSCRVLMDPRTGRIMSTINGGEDGGGGRGAPMTTGVAIPPRTPMGVCNIRRPIPQQHLMPMSGGPPIPMAISAQRRPMSAPTAPNVAPSPATVARASPVGVAAASTADKDRGFPCVNVQPKPQKVVPNLAARRSELDAKVKQLLLLSPQKFTEWLMRQELVPRQQYDLVRGGRRVKLKLSQDLKKYPQSGGYFWASESNPSKTTSVYHGSIFDVDAPNVVLKLMYHWACQTNIINVVQWVKVDQSTINSFYQVFRCVCLASVQNELVNLGGNNKIVEVGVISLGTASPDGNKREVRVEVLGVLDRASGKFRLRATEPRKGASQAERFQQIFLPLPMWVVRNSKIVTDNSIDKDKLKQLGYNVIQSSAVSGRPEGSNILIMDYLKKVVPKMYQNALSSLTINQIQQFLDELTFRELYGNQPLLCFDSLIERTATQTRAAFNSSNNTTMMTAKMRKIAENPFSDWRILAPQIHTMAATLGTEDLPPSSERKIDSPSMNQPRTSMKRTTDFTPEVDDMIAKRFKAASELVKLESYYYAKLQGDTQVLADEFKADMTFKCHLCKKVFMNNIEFMKHLSLHVETDRANAVDLADLCQCKYCLLGDFETSSAMQAHLDEHHRKRGSEFVCRICEEGFQVKNQLIHHMSVTHVPLEMPHACGVCTFRSSFRCDVVDHFLAVHDRTDKMQCPQCLKTFTLFGDKGYNTNVASAFVAHLQVHQDKKVKCKKCCLNFHSDKDRKAHVDKDHVSFKGFDNLEVYSYAEDEEALEIPQPSEHSVRMAARKSGSFKPQQQQSTFAAQNLEDILMYDVEQEDCGECGKKLNAKSHFAAYLCCTKCCYSTCCSKAMSVHVSLFHGPSGKPAFNLGLPINLEEELFCCCGFKTRSGNKMAKHLGASSCRTAYPDLETAQDATVRPLSST